jgi:hypothetical protein
MKPVVADHLPLEERLAILRNADSLRAWSSLDNTRFCILCGRTFTGRQVSFQADGRGGYTPGCPTEDCPSTVRDWFYHCARPGAAKAARSRTDEAEMDFLTMFGQSNLAG